METARDARRSPLLAHGQIWPEVPSTGEVDLETSTVLKLAAAVAVGGAVMWLWPTYGSCLSDQQTVDLEPFREVSLGCQAATATYVDWSDRARIEFSCADQSERTVNVADQWPTSTACGLDLELVDHWQDATGREVISLWVGRP